MQIYIISTLIDLGKSWNLFRYSSCRCSWSCHLCHRQPKFLLPVGLYFKAAFGIWFVVIPSTCWNNFFWYHLLYYLLLVFHGCLHFFGGLILNSVILASSISFVVLLFFFFILLTYLGVFPQNSQIHHIQCKSRLYDFITIFSISIFDGIRFLKHKWGKQNPTIQKYSPILHYLFNKWCTLKHKPYSVCFIMNLYAK